MRLGAVLRRARRKLREDGVVPLVRDSVQYVRRGFTLRHYQSTRVDLEERLELIEPRIKPEDRHFLDIGCAEGNITNRISEHGLFAIGIDRHPDPIRLARSQFGLQECLGFVRYRITPDTIGDLPSFDVVGLLTVYHHWVDEFGHSAAEDMLRTLGSKSNKIFFEVPDNELHLLDSVNERRKPAGFAESLEMLFEGDADVEHLGTTAYRDGERRDSLFLIRSSEFSDGDENV